MELPHRAKGDVLVKPGELSDIRRRLAAIAPRHDLTTVIISCFDHRTRMLPFFFAELRMAPAGARAIGAAMADSGFEKTRIVLQQWNRYARPSAMRLDGRIPDILMLSSMQLCCDECKELIRDAYSMEPSKRPLIIVGGPLVIYEPWSVFSNDPHYPYSADVAVTGEEYVLLEFLEVLLSMRMPGESVRAAYVRARDSGALDDIPGVVYGRGGTDGVAEELVDTGIQRLVADLDELSFADIGYGLLEAPGRSAGLAPSALPANLACKHSPIGNLVLTLGCNFSCHYCPIPAYNQRQYRAKSGPRIAEEMYRVFRRCGIRYYLGADDNFFCSEERAVKILESIANFEADGVVLRRNVRWGTEVTLHDAWKMRDHLKLARSAGLRALWIGVEDMTAKLIAKGQNVEKTVDTIRLLRQNRISPMPMLMHHDEQPLYTPGKPDGLLNQVRLLRKAGAMSVQVLMLAPAPGSRSYEESFTSGLVYESVGGKAVEHHIIDGNYVIMSKSKRPWRKQLNLIIVYIYFYNPVRLLGALVWPGRIARWRDVLLQLIGMWGLAYTLWRTVPWMVRLMTRKIKRATKAPISPIPMRDARGGAASHAVPGTPVAGATGAEHFAPRAKSNS